MRLKHIKLAGFKSFVDPTTINFAKNMTGIIGPNGCGKSNTIDAVRWVMGESSAKQLRGDTMDDVIFNGSSSRAAVSRASVELVFDNSQQKLLGQYAEYNEISIKREVTKEGASNYYLNGSRCRRKDIADIFLGTGLGPRSYAIIEQGMISRVVEAKPEELRVYLEEAAGISKYKERRRETENRIRHTKDNLDRLNDLREEIEKQIRSLERQSKQAEKYKTLKAEETQTKAELLALQWRDYDKKVRADNEEVQQQQVKLEAENAALTSIEKTIEQLRQTSQQIIDDYNQVQSEYYQSGADIAKTEQSIQHHKDLLQRIEQEIEQLGKSTESARAAINEDQAKISQLEKNVASQSPELDELKLTEQQSVAQLVSAEKSMHAWQQQWDDFTKEYAQTEQQINIERNRIAQLQDQQQRTQARHEKLNAELQQTEADNVEDKLSQLIQAESELQQTAEAFDENLEQLNRDVASKRENLRQTQQQYEDINRQFIETSGELSSLQALQKNALGKTEATEITYIEQNQLQAQTRLGEDLHVEAGWEIAVETVLADQLDAICVPNSEQWQQLTHNLNAFDGEKLTLLQTADAPPAAASDTLASKIKTSANIQTFVASIYIAESTAAALQRLPQLAAHESIVTQQGVWFGHGWAKVIKAQQDESSVLARQQKIDQYQATVKQLSEKKQLLAEQQNQLSKQLAEFESSREQQIAESKQTLQSLSAKRTELANAKNKIEQTQHRHSVVQSELAEIAQQASTDKNSLQQSQEKLAIAEEAFAEQQKQRAAFLAQRETHRQALEASKQSAEQHKEAAHRIAMALQAMQSEKDVTDQSLLRMRKQIEQLEQRKVELQESQQNSHQPIAALQQTLQQQLETKNVADKKLAEARAQVDNVNASLQEKEKLRSQHANQKQAIQQGIDSLRLQAQENIVRRKTIEERLQETEHDKATILAALPEDAAIDAWSSNLDAIAQKIGRLGNINLLAIDELKEATERKEYLDQQFDDLTSALDTLENAIAKIDKETRSRFKEVFDLVNAQISEMFPRLFGGGQAYLELTGQDLLNTGVSIMARPPGKRIANIHLLSGGEKALTAVAMVFAIFKLNPAPFCMLDEVDAPLDEANVARFCDLVREMSEHVQMIMITHNKTSMELSDQLMGVTMRESGVSRLVSVDIDEASRMVAS